MLPGSGGSRPRARRGHGPGGDAGTGVCRRVRALPRGALYAIAATAVVLVVLTRTGPVLEQGTTLDATQGLDAAGTHLVPEQAPGPGDRAIAKAAEVRRVHADMQRLAAQAQDASTPAPAAAAAPSPVALPKSHASGADSRGTTGAEASPPPPAPAPPAAAAHGGPPTDAPASAEVFALREEVERLKVQLEAAQAQAHASRVAAEEAYAKVGDVLGRDGAAAPADPLTVPPPAQAAADAGAHTTGASRSAATAALEYPPTPQWEAFSERAGSSVEVLMDATSYSDANYEMRDVKWGSKLLLHYPIGSEARGTLLTEKPKLSGIGTELLSEAQWKAAQCDRVLDGPVFYFKAETLDNVWHIHNDNLLPVYRMLHDAGYGRAPQQQHDGLDGAGEHTAAAASPTSVFGAGTVSSPRRKTYAIYSVDSASGRRPPLKFFGEILELLFDEVVRPHDMGPQGANPDWTGTTCMPYLRAGKPDRVFAIAPQPVLHYFKWSMGRKFSQFVAAKAGLPAPPSPPEAAWPPRVTILQRTDKRVLVDPYYFKAAFREYGVEAQTVVFSKSVPVMEQVRVLAQTDIFVTVHGGGNGLMYYMPEGGVFVHILPHHAPPWELSIIRRHALLRGLGYVSDVEAASLYAGADWKDVKRVVYKETYKDVYPVVIDAVAQYVALHPQAAASIRLPHAAAHPDPLLSTVERFLNNDNTIPIGACYTPTWSDATCGEEHFRGGGRTPMRHKWFGPESAGQPLYESQPVPVLGRLQEDDDDDLS